MNSIKQPNEYGREKINLTEQLKKYFGFDTFKGNQEAIIQNLLGG